ncbi:MAG: hypothetical protein PHS33_09675 [Candidatus Omnitrophica bacterium]|nr:hypothetical protein [Candidatus Omnitrophota bacterium]
MKLTIEKLTEWGACKEGKDWFISQDETDEIEVVKKLIYVRIDWANWLVVRLMTHSQQVQYAIFAAEQVLDIFEKEYPDDKRPRKAIKAAKAYLRNPTEKNKNAAARAADAAYAAARAAARAAYAAARAADAAYAAADAADAAYAAYAAARAADAAYAAAYAAARAEMKKRIINYGIKLLNHKEK